MVEIAPETDWGWNALHEVAKLEARIADLEKLMKELEIRMVTLSNSIAKRETLC